MDNDTVNAALKKAISQRRSTRAYTDQMVPDELIEEVLEAGRHAPSANNLQTTRFYVITNPEKLALLRDTMNDVLQDTTEKEGMSPGLLSLIKRAMQGGVDVTYGAPVLIVTTNRKGSANAIADCSCALQNMMLTASANGLGNCWINQFHSFRETPQLKSVFAELGLSKDEEICGSLILGYAENPVIKPIPITGNRVTYIR